MMLRNKKAVAADDMIMALIVIILIVIILVTFMVINIGKDGATRRSVKRQLGELDANYHLHTFLRQPVGGRQNIADRLVWAYLNEDFRNVEPRARTFFGPLYDGRRSSWALHIWEMPGHDTIKRFEGSSAAGWGSYDSTYLSSAVIPLVKDDEYLEIWLYRLSKEEISMEGGP